MTIFKSPILSKRRTIRYYCILTIWYLGFLCAILSFFSKKNPYLLLFLVSNFIWIIGNIFIRKYKIIGEFELKQDSVKISIDKELVFDVNYVSNIFIKYFGAKGDSGGSYAGLFRFKDGTGNYFGFDYNGQKYLYEILVINKNFLYSINNILRYWKNNNIDFKIFNSNNKDITTQVVNRERLYF